jgi:hypothetical protein
MSEYALMFFNELYRQVLFTIYSNALFNSILSSKLHELSTDAYIPHS